jgi:hypothetical protein
MLLSDWFCLSSALSFSDLGAVSAALSLGPREWAVENRKHRRRHALNVASTALPTSSG